jgi:leishmanolysin-like peptidase
MHPTLLVLFHTLAITASHTHSNLRSTHRCVHNTLPVPTPNEQTRSTQPYATTTTTMSMIDGEDPTSPIKSQQQRRRLATKSNMRIHVQFSSALTASSATLDTNIKTWTQQAITYWESALKVVPVEPHLSFDLTCTLSFPFTGTTVTQCAAYALSETCSGETIPTAWLKAGRHCSTCYQSGPDSCTGCTDVAAGTGLASKDYAILVTSVDTATCQSSTETLGYASPCKYDQYNRPILGSINYCPNAMASATAAVALSTAKHELAHALGFTASMIPYFRDPTTSTLVPRTTIGSDGLAQSATKVCADGQTRTLPAPVSTTLNGPTTVRGFVNSYILTTPNIKKAAIEHFNCPSLTGIELENQPTGDSSSCWGAHWEQRILHTELMTPVVGENSVVSEFTLGFFEDTGWYESDYAKAERLYWGDKMGCSFINDKCNTGTKSNPTMQGQSKGYFCNEEHGSPYTATMTGCTHNGLSKGYCNLQTWSSNIAPNAFSYFTNAKNGGANSNLDYCPMYSGFSNGGCMDTTQQLADGSNAYGDLYGSTSKCVRSTTVQTTYVTPTIANSVCAAIVCNGAGTSATVTLKDKSGTSQSITCATNDKGVGKTMTNFNSDGQIICPDLSVYCDNGHNTFVSWYDNQTIVTTPESSNNKNDGSAPSNSPAPSIDDGLGKEDLPAHGSGTRRTWALADFFGLMFCLVVLVL